MTEITLVLEHAPTPQRQTTRLYHGGLLTIGRGDEADWQIEDPDMFVSRKHCVISDETGVPTVTNSSTGGLHVDGASQALGAGNSVRLENDMRLRMGDFVIRVEMKAAAATAAPRSGPGAAFSFEFAPAPAPEPPKARPKDLPSPFGLRTDNLPSDREEKPRPPPRPLDDADPFALDLAPPRPVPPPATAPDTAPDQPRPAQRAAGGYFSDAVWSAPAPARSSEPPAPSAPEPRAAPTPAAPPESPAPRPEVQTAGEEALRAAFYRGLGLDPRRFPAADTEAEMEELGRRFRALADGLVHLLRTRAQEKQKVRVAQTIVGAANVNPLKFAVTSEDALEALLTAKGPGYLGPDDAITQSYRDLADHQVRTWAALQAALRRMIDRFDPEEVERQLEDAGRLETLLAGGRNAKLWQLYVERYQDIARAAEERFLGEVGADFQGRLRRQREEMR